MDDINALSVLPPELRDRLIKYREYKAQRIAEIGQEAFDKEMAEERNAEKDAEERERLKARSTELLEKSGLVDDVKRYTFDNFLTGEDWQRKMKDLCRRFIGQNEAKFLYMSGQPGCGKTHLCTAVCAHYINTGVSTRYVIFDSMMDDFRGHVNDDDYDDVFAKYVAPNALYIDDFMKFTPSEADKKHSFKLLNKRMIQRKITIITSERALNEIIRMDEALGGRIKLMCGEFFINVSGKEGRDYRLKGQA